MIKGLAHVCLAATDLAAAERFYCNGLGFRKTFDFVRKNQVIGFYLEVSPGLFIEIFQRDTIDAKAISPIQHFCLEVDDLDPVGRRLVEAGFEVTPKTLGADHSWQMWTTDPSGVRIEFHQYTERSCQITRENCLLK
jgi:catechol 2,3-dioxygenase-like lactoylglutathione lyase family enzyme